MLDKVLQLYTQVLLWVKTKYVYYGNLWRFRGRTFKNPLAVGNYRNCMCPCGSGKKVKRCHGVNTSISFREYHNLISMMAKAQRDLAASIKHIKDQTK